MRNNQIGWQLAVATTLFLCLSGPALADRALEARIAKYKVICSDYERSKNHVECHRPPGSYLAAYEMTGERRKRALEQGRRAMQISTDTDEHMKRKLRTR